MDSINDMFPNNYFLCIKPRYPSNRIGSGALKASYTGTEMDLYIVSVIDHFIAGKMDGNAINRRTSGMRICAYSVLGPFNGIGNM